MIALSSFRPFDQCTPARQENFIDAYLTWGPIFSSKWYFNDPEPRLFTTEKTGFILGSNAKPSIQRMARYASIKDEYCVILNADIQLSPKIAGLEKRLKSIGGQCCISQRVEPNRDMPSDLGLDFFCASPEVWKQVSERIPERFTLGRIRFDTWLCTFFSTVFRDTCYVLEPGLIIHPNHEERGDQSMDDLDDPFLLHPAWPKQLLKHSKLKYP